MELFRSFHFIIFFLFTVDCCRVTMDPIARAHQRSAFSLDDEVKQMIEMFLEVSRVSNVVKDIKQKQNEIEVKYLELKERDINDDWQPTLYQLWKGQDLHSLDYLQQTLSVATAYDSENDHLQDYQFFQLSEIKVWLESGSGKVILYFPASIDLGVLDIFHVLTSQMEEKGGFAKYVKNAAKRNYNEFATWFKDTQNFIIKGLTIFGHSRGAAVADLFFIIGRQDLFQYVDEDQVSLVRGSPLPSLQYSSDNRFQNVNVINLVMVGNEFRDPYTKFNKNFYHPTGKSYFFMQKDCFSLMLFNSCVLDEIVNKKEND